MRTYVTPTSTTTPLSFDSAHRSSCKAWWPLAEARRYARTCGLHAAWEHQIGSLASEFKSYTGSALPTLNDATILCRRAALVNGRVGRRCVHASTQRSHDTRTCVIKLRSDAPIQRCNFEPTIAQHRYHLGSLRDTVNMGVCWLNHDKHMRFALRNTWPH